MRKWITWLLVVVIVTAGGYFGWQRIRQRGAQDNSIYQTAEIQRGELTAFVGTTGTVRANQTALLLWQISGGIGNIYVSLEEKVPEDFVLAELRKDSLPQSVILAEADLIAAQDTLDNLLNSSVSQSQAYLALVQAQEALEKAQNNRNSKDYQRASDATVDSARANYIIAQDAVDRAQEIYNMFSDTPEDNLNRASALSSLSAATQQRDRALAQLNWLLGKPDSLELSLADANLAVAQANLDAAQREWDRLKDGPDPEEIRSAEVRITALQNTLDSARLKAPFAGTVTEILSQVGDLVDPTTVSFRIDDLSKLIVDVKVPEVDINQVQPGQIARISFDAIQDRTYSGEVVDVARVGTTNPTGVDFSVTIELLDADQQVLSGMTAAVNIIVNQLSDALLVPNRAVRLRDASRVVYLLRNDQLVLVEIQLGAVSETHSEILAGDVHEGDQAVLNPPVEVQNNGGPPFTR